MKVIGFIKLWKDFKPLRFDLKGLVEDEDGVGTIEIVLILVVLIGLVLIFKTQIRDLLSGVFTEINGQASEIY